MDEQSANQNRPAGWDARPHDVVEFMEQLLGEFSSEYKRIRERTKDDPGTAGDQGEENWAELFRGWLPATYHVVTKGQILTSMGETSPQIDVLVLHPDYPVKLRTKKHYFSSGVVAAFECKNTLRRDGIKQAIGNSRRIAEMLQRERENRGYWQQPPMHDLAYDELHKPIIYGLLAHSHDWAITSARETITSAIVEIDGLTATHPREMIDIICVADVAVWSAGRCANAIQTAGSQLEFINSCTTQFTCLHADKWQRDTVYHRSFTTIGALLSRLYQKLSHINSSALLFANYLKFATKDGSSGGGQQRVWGELLSREARTTVPTTKWTGYW